jgi:translation initiation factor IF-2
MARKQIFKVAKELGVSSRELLQVLKEIGIEKKGNFSVLEEEEQELLLKHLERKAVPREAQAQVQAQPEVAEAPAVEAKEVEEEVAVAVKEPVGEPRPAVVAVLGHVDHGKTSLLDYIRKSHVASQEVGGITQSIGAYQVEYQGQRITFIDTPGHRAFTGMRARGAQVTDIVILVVAADDGVMEQTREAISHARAAGVPIIVAINKIDKPGVDINRVKQQLSDEGLTPEDWGGETITIPISALTGDGVEDLLEMILLVAELEELRADPKRPASGIVIESHLDPARGPIATAIIRDGTLRERDIVVAGAAHGRVRALLDHSGKRVREAPPGSPVQILGLSDVPPVGVPLEVVESPTRARRLVEARKEEERLASHRQARRTWEDVLAQTARQGALKLILKADTLGGLEAVQGELKRLETEEIPLELLHTGVGMISESDVLLAASSEEEVSVLGFRVGVDPKAKELADREGVTIRTYEIIYQLADDVAKALKGLMEPRYEEVPIGEAEVRNVFKIPKVGTVAGCYVREGQVRRGAQVRVLRGDSVIFEGRIQSLRRFDADVREVSKDKECGIKIEGFDDVAVGDRLEIFALREVERL